MKSITNISSDDEHEEKSLGLSFALIPTSFDIHQTQDKIFSAGTTFTTADGKQQVRWVGMRHGDPDRDLTLTGWGIPRPVTVIFEITHLQTQQKELICGPKAWIDPVFATQPVGFFAGEIVAAFKNDYLSDVICPSWPVMRAGTMDDYTVKYGEALLGFNQELKTAEDLEKFAQYKQIIAASRLGANGKLLGNEINNPDEIKVVKFVRDKMQKLYNLNAAKAPEEIKRVREYYDYIEKEHEKFGSGKGYGGTHDPMVYPRRVKNVVKRAKRYFPDLNHKQLIIEILQRSLSGEIKEGLLEADGNTINRAKLIEYIDSLGREKFGIRAATLTFSFAMDTALEDIYKKEGRLVPNKFGHEVVMYDPLPEDIIDVLKTKANKLKSLDELTQDALNKSVKKHAQNVTLFQERNYGFQYCSPDMRTGGSSIHYSVEHNGMEQKFLNKILKDAKEEERNQLVLAQADAKKGAFIERNSRTSHLEKILQSIVGGQIPLRSVEYAGRNVIQQLFDKHGVVIASNEQKQDAPSQADKIKLVIQDLRSAAITNMVIPQNTTIGHKGLLAWIEASIFIRGETIAVDRSSCPAKEIKSTNGNVFMQMLAEKGEDVIFETEEHEQESMREVYNHFVMPLGLDKYGLRSRAIWHDKNQLDFPIVTCVLRELEYEGKIPAIKGIHLLGHDERVRFLALHVRENISNIVGNGLKLDASIKDDNEFIQPLLKFYYQKMQELAAKPMAAGGKLIDETSVLSPHLQVFIQTLAPTLHEGISKREIREESTGTTYYKGAFSSKNAEEIAMIPASDNVKEVFARFTMNTSHSGCRNRIVNRLLELGLLAKKESLEYNDLRNNDSTSNLGSKRRIGFFEKSSTAPNIPDKPTPSTGFDNR